MMQLSSFGSFDKLEWLWYTYFLGGFPMSYMYSNVFANKEKLPYSALLPDYYGTCIVKCGRDLMYVPR